MNKIRINIHNNYSILPRFLRRCGFISLYSIILICILILPGGCSEDLGDKIYTETGETVGQYLSNRPETYSEFSKMLEKTEVIGLLNAYGKYTCFAPDNDAVFRLYELRKKKSIDDFPIDTLKKIVYDHIIRDVIIPSGNFVNGFLPNLTMSGRYINIGFEIGNEKITYHVNSTSQIREKDIQVHNGIIHSLSEVLLPTENTLVEVISSNAKYSMFYDALIETGLYEKLEAIRDDSYDPGSLIEKDKTIIAQDILQRVPRERKYGFTVLMESNETLIANGITDLVKMKEYAKLVYDQMYPEDSGITDPKDSRNSFNRFVAYHLINKKLSSKFFIEKYDNTGWFYDSKGTTHSVKTVDMFEYLETMCPNTLIEVRTLRSNNNEYNVFNMIESGEAVRLTDDFDNDAINGVFHEIDNMLVYSTEVDRMLSSKRLRMDAASFFPEFTNNNIRVGHASIDHPSERWEIPDGYVERLKLSPNTIFQYINSDDRFLDYQGDEVFIIACLYDFEVTTPPIPAGTYEVRFGYQPTRGRGVAQLYWDGVPSGIPLDLSILANDPRIGHETPGENIDDLEGFENDKMMHNRGYMKGPASIKVIDEAYYSGTGRESPAVLRRVLGIYNFDKTTTHIFKASAVEQGEFMFDYLEFVPLEVLEYEDIY